MEDLAIKRAQEELREREQEDDDAEEKKDEVHDKDIRLQVNS